MPSVGLPAADRTGRRSSSPSQLHGVDHDLGPRWQSRERPGRSPLPCRSVAATAALLALMAFGASAASPVSAQSAPPSPEDVLGYELGERFTDHGGVMRYMEALAAAAPDRVRLEPYGTTPEGRLLVQVIIARADYMARLDDVLARNRQLTNPDGTPAQAREIATSNPAVVYYSYGVHGNESSSSEAAMWTAWDLVRGAAEVAGVLDSVVVVIDPVANPDGRDRYVNGYRQARGARPNPNVESREHWEPWPGGRFNHYLFDLNRDWAWATQPETRARLATWDRWSPQVHVDFHEMGYQTTYFFFPAADPINPMYPRHTLDWAGYFGDANARAFDQHGWPYYTGEGFDLFYPGYGDSWPSLVGAIGMTYEQAGSGRAGLTVRLPDGQELTLAQRATQHRTSGNATLRAAAARRTELVGDFARFHQTVGDGLQDILIVPGEVAGPRDPRTAALVSLLQAQGIRVEEASRPFRTAAAPHFGFAPRREFPAGTLRVRARQPRGRLAITLLQPETVLDATHSYDISAWSLPFAYGIEAHSVRPGSDGGGWTALAPIADAVVPPSVPETAVGLLAAPGVDRWPAVIRYLEDGGRVRVLNEPFTLEGRDWPAGTLFFPRAGIEEWGERVHDAGLHHFATPVHSGRASRGNDLGTSRSHALSLPRVALLIGDGVSPTAAGAHWFFLEQTMQLPFDQLAPGRLSDVDLAVYDVIVAPDMGRNALGEPATDRLKEWVRRGGTLVATGSAARTVGAGIADIKLRERPEEPAETRLERALRGREDRQLERWTEQVPGAILTVQLDPAHPLAFGTGVAGDPTRLFVLHSGAEVFEPHPDFETVGFFRSELERVAGVISEKNLERLQRGSWLAVRRLDAGRVILFLDDPLFRHFWYSAFQPYANAIMIGPAL